MKAVIFSLIAAVSISATAAQYVTVTDCTRGESGQECAQVTYKVRPASKNQPAEVLCPVGEAAYAKCPTKVGVPAWLQAISNAFPGNGPVDQTEQYDRAGGN